MKTSVKILALVALSACALQVSADVIGVDLGTAVPPTTLGGYTVAAYDPGSITGADYYAHETAGSDDGTGTGTWETWGQSYTGRVYVASTSDELTLLLGPGTTAVYFYEEPQQFLDFSMTATDSSGTSVTTTINGFHGSSGVGFYETDPSDSLSEITVTCADPTGFAIGEFGINQGGSLTGTVGTVPDTGATLALIAFGLAGMVAFSRFNRRAVKA
jgi:hypothetical protein